MLAENQPAQQLITVDVLGGSASIVSEGENV